MYVVEVVIKSEGDNLYYVLEEGLFQPSARARAIEIIKHGYVIKEGQTVNIKSDGFVRSCECACEVFIPAQRIHEVHVSEEYNLFRGGLLGHFENPGPAVG